MLRLGSLFSGSGGFELAGSLCGIEPVFASEVEPYPIAVTRSRFPDMTHLGDVSKINGSEIEPVDVITFGSPCQDMSIAGKRAGEILFKREGVRGYFTEGGATREGTAGDAADCAGAADRAKCYSIDKAITTGGNCTAGGSCVCEEISQTLTTDRPHSVAYAVPYTLKICSGCEGGGKGALIQEDKIATLATNNDQYLFQPVNMVLDDQGGQQITVRNDGKAPTLRAETHGNLPCVLEAAGFKAGQSMGGGIGWQKECAATLAAQSSGTEPTVCIKKAYSIENHPADSRVDIDDSGKVQTLTSRMGTGGGNVPMVLEAHPVYCLQGNGIDRADTAGCNGKGWKENTSYTLNTIDRPAVVYCTDIGFFNSQEDVAPTLLARQYKDPHLVSYPENAVQYIVRRLTPTECARLQGFPDAWGHPDHKEDFTDEEYRFWLNVRNTHAAINGKPKKDYNKAQMLTWYNKLHTDSSEYKMWGNGIALPNALYVMQGIKEALKHE